MIAYNHYIKFIPELKNHKKVECPLIDTIMVIESLSSNLEKKFKYEMPFLGGQGRSLSLLTDRKFNRTQKGQPWAFEIKNVVTFSWYSGTQNLKYIKHENFTEELLKYWCLHIVLPVFFTVEEKYDFLHAGAVEVADKAILFIAPSMGGKSTMTEYFLKQGHAMISDDKVATYEKNGQFLAIPSYSHHRPYRKMEDLGFFVENFVTGPRPIHIIYELEKVDEDAIVKIEELHGVEKFKPLRKSSEINLTPLMLKKFQYLSVLIQEIPVYKVTIPQRFDRLEEVYNKIVKHCMIYYA